MRALITGAAGFLGRNFTRALQAHPNIELTLADIAYGTDCRDLFADDTTRYDLVLHLAAVVGGRETIENDPLRLAAANLTLDAEMFAWANRTKQHKVVYFSSSAAYPTALQSNGYIQPLRECDITLDRVDTPDHTYGWTKLTGEILAHYSQQTGRDVLVVRPFSGYGTDQDVTYPFGAFIDRALTQQDPFTVWGNGSQVRDFIHVDDIVNATLKAVDDNVTGPINLCTGVGTSLNELAYRVLTAAGHNPTVAHELEAPRGVQHRVGDPTYLSTFYTPKVSLQEGINRALNNR